ncbi:ECF transporter S component [Enterococcus hulanensis]|mgnify:FL=1|uniref:ECF transporter S component n=1 Tax=Enterococcus hulanensis TaxID=2559929 RepID=A0ABU3F2K4_9ENTE|nr:MULTISPECIES: ECF transporter S component [Enterococcus]MBX8938248.1 ECF transporter S component [Enterococcus gilvus]MDT2601346.1 ECF transporter S component [Enterococcus hulanensis]MDT2610744.1 ECF transporter S component [Enterococcus hulanensis]MDT2618149.1 ECF transporter S component [Enterococcus hulanensis]MDT2629281.1 ECF transporter S component [Enterococcus hulanensis]
MKEKNVRNFTLTAMFLAIMIILAVTPLGFIPIGPINATTMHIPVIIASIVLGPRIGAGLGAVFGVISLARATVIITPMSFVFSPFIANPLTNQGDWRAVIVAIIPRILIGVVPYFVYKGLHRLMKEKVRPVSLFIAGVAGSLTNTILVMNLIFFFFKDSYANVLQVTADAVYGVILGIIFGSGLVEAIVAGIATMGVSAVLLRLMKK